MGEETGGVGPPGDKTIDNEFKDINSFDLLNKYKCNDEGPYFVYVEHLKKNFGRLFPMKIGYYLLEANEFKNDILDIVAVGANRVKVVFKTYSIANSLIQHNIVTKNQLVAYIPTFFNHRKGVIRMVDTTFSESFLTENIECHNSKVIRVQRMKRKITNADGNQILVDRQMIIVTFLGNSIPQKVRINLSYFTVDPYVQPVVQCFKCLRYGHTSKLCKSKTQRCKTCSDIHDENINCEDSNSFCLYCQSNDHSSISKNCPMFINQYKIKKEMAARNIPFKDAEKIVNNPSYAKIVTHNQFSVLNNDINFPSLPDPKPTLTSKLYVQKPKQFSPTRKRKQISPLPSPPVTSKKVTFVGERKSILPNPYRDEYMLQKEKMISGISEFIQKNFGNKSKTGKLATLNSQQIKEAITSIVEEMDVDPEVETFSVSDESTY